MKAVALLLVVLVVCASAQEVKDQSNKDVSHSKDVKDVDLSKLVGNWYQIAATKEHKYLLKGCSCNQLSFHKMEENKLFGVSSCKNMTTGQTQSVNGTLTQLKDRSNAFRIEFVESNVAAIKQEEINKTAAQEVKPIKEEIVKDVKKDDKSTSHADTHADKKGDEMSDKDANAYIIKLDKEYRNFILATPEIKGVWILSKDKTMDENTFKQYSDFVNKEGYQNLIKIDHSKC